MPVALNPPFRIQDQQDFGSTPGAGNDGYAITWDNGAGEFVLSSVAAPVSSVFGRTGAVVAVSGDYTASQVTNAAATNAANTFTVTPQSIKEVSGNLFQTLKTDGTTVSLSISPSGFPNNPSHVLTFLNGSKILDQSTRFLFLVAAAQFQVFDAAGDYYIVRNYRSASLSTIDGGDDSAAGNQLRIFSQKSDLLLQGAYNSAASSISNAVTIRRTLSSGTAGAGYGVGLSFVGNSSTTTYQDMARIVALWDVATHASRSAALQILISNSGGEVNAATFDDDATAGNTRMLLYDVDNGQLERVSVGVADSGGIGYKLLRIAN